jgi:hypothetical protein
MSSRWEPAVAQTMQRHGGSHHSRPKVTAPAIVPDVAPSSQQPMAMQSVPLAPEMKIDDETLNDETWD